MRSQVFIYQMNQSTSNEFALHLERATERNNLIRERDYHAIVYGHWDKSADNFDNEKMCIVTPFAVKCIETQ